MQRHWRSIAQDVRTVSADMCLLSEQKQALRRACHGGWRFVSILIARNLGEGRGGDLNQLEVVHTAVQRPRPQAALALKERKQVWRQRADAFMRRVKDVHGKRHQNARLFQKQSRKPSLELIRALANALFAGTGLLITDFCNFSDVKSLNLEAIATLGLDTVSLSGGDRTRELVDAFPEHCALLARLRSAVPPKVLHIQYDEAGTNRVLASVLQRELQANVVAGRDPCHRHWNDLCLSLKDAGFFGLMVLSMVHYNLCYGPFLTSAWFRDLQDAVQHLGEGACLG